MLDYTFERRLELAEEESREIIDKLTSEKEQLATEKEQLTIENGQLSAEINRMKELCAEHGIETE